MDKYIVAFGQTIWHSKEDKYYKGGEEVDLSHLSPQGIAALVAVGAVIPLEKPTEKAEPKKKEKAADVS